MARVGRLRRQWGRGGVFQPAPPHPSWVRRFGSGRKTVFLPETGPRCPATPILRPPNPADRTRPPPSPDAYSPFARRRSPPARRGSPTTNCPRKRGKLTPWGAYVSGAASPYRQDLPAGSPTVERGSDGAWREPVRGRMGRAGSGPQASWRPRPALSLRLRPHTGPLSPRGASPGAGIGAAERRRRRGLRCGVDGPGRADSGHGAQQCRRLSAGVAGRFPEALSAGRRDGGGVPGRGRVRAAIVGGGRRARSHHLHPHTRRRHTKVGAGRSHAPLGSRTASRR